MDLIRIKTVEPLQGFSVRVAFSDGTERDIDLEKYLRGPVFEAIRNNPEVFRSVRVTEGRTIGWGEDVDIDPDTLYHDLPPAWVQHSEVDLAA